MTPAHEPTPIELLLQLVEERRDEWTWPLMCVEQARAEYAMLRQAAQAFVDRMADKNVSDHYLDDGVYVGLLRAHSWATTLLGRSSAAEIVTLTELLDREMRKRQEFVAAVARARKRKANRKAKQ